MNVQEFEMEVRDRIAGVEGLSQKQQDDLATTLVQMRNDTDNFTVYVNRSVTMNEANSREATDQSTDENMSDEQVDETRPEGQDVADERPEGVDRAEDRGEEVEAGDENADA